MPRTAVSASGFTLVEMLLVVTLVVITAGIALPNLRSINDTYRISNASETIASKLRQARASALKRNRPTWVAINGAARNVKVQTASPGGPVDIGVPALMPTGVTFGTGHATVILMFDGKGRPLVAPQTVHLLYPGSGLTRTITITSTGLVTVN